MRKSVRKNVSPEGSPQVAHRREAVRLQLAVLRQKVHQERRVAASSSDAHWGEEVLLFDVRQEVHAERSLDQAREDPREPEEEELCEQKGIEQGEFGARGGRAERVPLDRRTVHDDLSSRRR